MKSALGNLIREERLRLEWTQHELGMQVGVGQSTISNYENGNQEIPDDVIQSLAQKMNSVRIRMAYSNRVHGQVLNVPLLNLVDTNIIAILTAVIEESNEVIESAQVLIRIMRNKTTQKSFTEREWKEIEYHCEQIGDIYAAVNLSFTEAVEKFDLDTNKITKNLIMKYIDKQYLSFNLEYQRIDKGRIL